MRSIFVSLAFCVLFTFIGIASGGQAPQVPATIQEVFVDFTNQRIMIEGTGFNTSGPVQVNLGLVGDISSLCNANLVSNPQSIVCNFLPGGLPPDGEYLLSVTTGTGNQARTDTYDLSVGAIGPIGPAGPQGPQGADGPNWSHGSYWRSRSPRATGSNGTCWSSRPRRGHRRARPRRSHRSTGACRIGEHSRHNKYCCQV